MAYNKLLILIRHGETEKDKTNPNRKLTKNGKKQVKSTCKKLKPHLKNLKGIVITSDRLRALETANIVSKEFGIKIVKEISNSSVENITILENEKPIDLDLTFYYFKNYIDGKLPKAIPSPKTISRRIMRVIGKFVNPGFIIVIGHGIALESLAVFQNKYKLVGKLNKELEYGDYLILKSSYNCSSVK